MGNKKSKLKNNEKKVAEKLQSNQNNSINSVESLEILTEAENVKNVSSTSVEASVEPRKSAPLPWRVSRGRRVRAVAGRSVSFEAGTMKGPWGGERTEESLRGGGRTEESLRGGGRTEESLRGGGRTEKAGLVSEEGWRSLTAESATKVNNIENLIEAIDNFNKIFAQFPEEYYRFMRKMSNFEYLIKNGKNNKEKNEDFEKNNTFYKGQNKKERDFEGKRMDGKKEAKVSTFWKKNEGKYEENRGKGEKMKEKSEIIEEKGEKNEEKGVKEGENLKREGKYGRGEKENSFRKVKKGENKKNIIERGLRKVKGLGKEGEDLEEYERSDEREELSQKMKVLWKEHLRVVAEIQPRLADHAVAVQKMALLMAKSEERMESERRGGMVEWNKQSLLELVLSSRRKKKGYKNGD